MKFYMLLVLRHTLGLLLFSHAYWQRISFKCAQSFVWLDKAQFWPQGLEMHCRPAGCVLLLVTSSNCLHEELSLSKQHTPMNTCTVRPWTSQHLNFIVQPLTFLGMKKSRTGFRELPGAVQYSLMKKIFLLYWHAQKESFNSKRSSWKFDTTMRETVAVQQ